MRSAAMLRVQFYYTMLNPEQMQLRLQYYFQVLMVQMETPV
jgi:hypothetical protein